MKLSILLLLCCLSSSLYIAYGSRRLFQWPGVSTSPERIYHTISFLPRDIGRNERFEYVLYIEKKADRGQLCFPVGGKFLSGKRASFAISSSDEMLLIPCELKGALWLPNILESERKIDPNINQNFLDSNLDFSMLTGWIC
jgi:hypothetical protein